MTELNIPGLDFMSTIKEIQNITQSSTELHLPMLKVNVKVSPIESEEEIAMLESKSAPYEFDKRLVELLYSKTDFSGCNDDRIKEQVSTADGFAAILTNVDKQVIEYGVLNASYDKLPDREVVCKCGNKEVISLPIDELIQPDSFDKTWDKEISVTDWATEFDIKLSEEMTMHVSAQFSFSKALNDVIRIANMDDEHAKLLEEYGLLHTVQDAFHSMVKEIKIVKDGEITNTYTDMYKIVAILKNIPLKNKHQVLEYLSEKSDLGIYEVKFYTPHGCTSCGTVTDVIVESPLKELLSRTMGLI